MNRRSLFFMVEFMPSVSYEILFQGIRKLVSNGYTPILAHMERYGCLRKKGTSELLDIGCKLQMNYDSIQGHWFSPEVRWCREQVKSGVIHFLGKTCTGQITDRLKSQRHSNGLTVILMHNRSGALLTRTRCAS